MTTGTIVFIGSACAFVFIIIFLLIYLTLTSKKIKKILNQNEFPEE